MPSQALAARMNVSPVGCVQTFRQLWVQNRVLGLPWILRELIKWSLLSSAFHMVYGVPAVCQAMLEK